MRNMKRTVISAESSQLADVERLVDAGRYRTVSEFVREAMVEKLQRERDSALAEEVARYVATAAEASHDEVALIRAQGLPGARRRAKARAPKAPAPVRRAKR